VLSLVYYPLSYDPFRIYATKLGLARGGSLSESIPAYSRLIINHLSSFGQYPNENSNLNSESFPPSILIPYKAETIEYFDL
jgi:hypothetical protein